MKFHIWAFEGPATWEHTRKPQNTEEKARGKKVGYLGSCPQLSPSSDENFVTGRAG